jgi:hypothetical protein
MNGRLYDPVIGRFLSPDPLPGSLPLSQSWNPYSYVMNQPSRLIDPTGLAATNALCRDGSCAQQGSASSSGGLWGWASFGQEGSCAGNCGSGSAGQGGNAGGSGGAAGTSAPPSSGAGSGDNSQLPTVTVSHDAPQTLGGLPRQTRWVEHRQR